MGSDVSPTLLRCCLLLAALACYAVDFNPPGLEQVVHGDCLWRLLPNLWTTKTIVVDCPNSKGDFDVYLADSKEQLQRKVERKDHAWCGFNKVLFDTEECRAGLSPFGDTHIFVPRPRRGGNKCTFRVSQKFSAFMLSLGIVGLLLYNFAGPLSESLIFRLGAGSVSFMLLSAVILLFVVYRTLPNKRAVAAMFTLFGTSMAGWFRFFFGQWIPSVHQLVSSKVVWLYMAVTCIIGWGVTYYFDREDNHKLHTILRYAMKLLGLGLIAFSTSVPGISLTVCLALVATDLRWVVPHSWLEGFQSVVMRRGVPVGPNKKKTTGATKVLEEGSPWRKLGKLMDEAINTRLPWETKVDRGDFTPVRSDSQTNISLSSREVGTPTARNSSIQQGQGSSDSPLVQRGLMLNVSTGRAIKIGGPTYQALQDKGWEADMREGVIKPPGATPSKGGSPGSSRSKRGSSAKRTPK
eukprot:jgi/Botrbrau1/4664/Bobra.33_2s0034.2